MVSSERMVEPGRYERRGRHEVRVGVHPRLDVYRQRAEDLAARYGISLEGAVRVLRDSVDQAYGVKVEER